MGNQQHRKAELTVEDIKMLEQNTVLSRSQILQWFDDFQKECKSGGLDKKDFIRFYKELIPDHPNADKFCEYVFQGKLI